jgi:hypothetical protein
MRTKNIMVPTGIVWGVIVSLLIASSILTMIGYLGG